MFALTLNVHFSISSLLSYLAKGTFHTSQFQVCCRRFLWLRTTLMFTLFILPIQFKQEEKLVWKTICPRIWFFFSLFFEKWMEDLHNDMKKIIKTNWIFSSFFLFHQTNNVFNHLRYIIMHSFCSDKKNKSKLFSSIKALFWAL